MKDFGLDTYERHARLKPALLATLPAAWTVLAWAPGHALGWGGLWSLFVAAGGTYLMAQIARDRGKALEPRLFESFGGRPTERLLSHAQSDNAVLLARRHAQLRGLFPDIDIPTAAEELKDPARADLAFRTCVSGLIARTREQRDRYPLVFQENCAYGFRRNFLRLKPFGLSIAILASTVLGLRLYLEFSTHSPVSPLIVTFEVLNVLFVLMWLVWIRPHWVLLTAKAYADRLVESLETLR